MFEALLSSCGLLQRIAAEVHADVEQRCHTSDGDDWCASLDSRGYPVTVDAQPSHHRDSPPAFRHPISTLGYLDCYVIILPLIFFAFPQWSPNHNSDLEWWQMVLISAHWHLLIKGCRSARVRPTILLVHSCLARIDQST